MLTQKQVDALYDIDGVDWIGALCPEAIKKLATNGAIQMGLFDKRNLFELKHPDFPGERLIACRNAELAHRRAIKRESLLKAPVKELDRVRGMVRRGRLSGKKEIDARVRGILKKYGIGKHFELDIRENDFNFEINRDKVKKEAALDGIYIVRTSLFKERMDTDETVRSYKLLSQAERAFRSFKPVDLMVRSDSAMKKVRTKRLDDGSRVYSFRSLLGHLGAIVRATCRCSGERDTSATFTMITRRNPKQQKAFDLLQTIRV